MKQLSLNIKQQQGAVLAISLIILLALTLIGLASLQATSLDGKIAGNLRELNIAMQSSESALREAEAFINGLSNTAAFGSNGLYHIGDAPDEFANSTWSGNFSIVTTGDVGVAQKPRYFIELAGIVNSDSDNIGLRAYGSSDVPITMFRIVSRGTGGTGSAQIILEEFYGRRL